MMRPLPLLVIAATLTACAPGIAQNRTAEIQAKIAEQGQYWQRVDATSAIWQQGPKAQQVLNRDIARCVTELSELERLGQIKGPIAPQPGSPDAVKAQAQLNAYDSPERDGALLVEPTQYTDFEGCMVAKGWERVAYVPYDGAARGSDAYLKNHINYRDFRGQSREKFLDASSPDAGRKGYND